MINLNWIKYLNGNWYELLSLDLSHPHFNNLNGVYVIWHDGAGHNVVKVGQGEIRNRLSEHRSDQTILAFRNPNLFVTWAALSPELMDGIERFLSDQFNPKIGSRYPNAASIMVNLPA